MFTLWSCFSNCQTLRDLKVKTQETKGLWCCCCLRRHAVCVLYTSHQAGAGALARRFRTILDRRTSTIVVVEIGCLWSSSAWMNSLWMNVEHSVAKFGNYIQLMQKIKKSNFTLWSNPPKVTFFILFPTLFKTFKVLDQFCWFWLSVVRLH